MNIFEKASVLKLRFPTTKGQIATEDLWDLSLVSLNALAMGVNKQVKESTEESFITTKTKANAVLELQLEILKHVIQVKLQQAEVKKLASAKAEELSFLKDLLKEKEIDEMKGQSKAEIAARIAALES